MDSVVRIAMYVIVGIVLLTLNGLYIRRIYYEFHRVEPSPVIAPFRVIGAKDDPEKGKALAQMLIARLNRLNDDITEAMRILNTASPPKTETASASNEPVPMDIRFESPVDALDDLPFGEFEPVDVNLSFGGVELGGLVSWGQRLVMSDRMVSISVQYDGPKTTLSMTPNRTAGESIWLELDNADDRALITDLAYAFMKRGWEATDEDIKKLTLAEFKALTTMIQDAARVKAAGDRTTAADYAALDAQIDQLLTPHSRAWESQRILKMCAVIADTAGNKPRAMALYTRLTPTDTKERELVQAATQRLALLLTDPRTSQVLVAITPQPVPIAAAAAPPAAEPARSVPAPAQPPRRPAEEPVQTASAAPEPVPVTADTTPAPVALQPEPAAPPVPYFVRDTPSLLAQLHVPSAPMSGAPVVAIIGSEPDPRVQPFTTILKKSGGGASMVEYSTHLAEFVRLVAPTCKLAFAGVESGRDTEILEALNASVANGADIILLTYGPLTRAVELAVETITKKGTLVVTAAGNRGRGVPPHMAGAGEHVLIVSAADNRGQPASFTQASPETVWAPGTGFMIASLSGRVIERSGTAYAAALAAGAAARILGENPNMNPEEIISRLRKTSRPVVTGGVPLINVAEALR